MRVLSILCLLPLASCVVNATDSTPCMSPAGTYTLEFKPTNGNCPDAVVKALVEGGKDTTTKASVACKTESVSATTSFDVPDLAMTCSAAVSGSKIASSGGYSGTMSFALTCSDNTTCQHAFIVSYTKQ